MYFIIGIIVFVCLMFVFAFLLNGILLKYFKTLGTAVSADEVRWNTRKPAIGGISFYICFLLATLTMMYTIPEKDFFNFREFYGIVIAVTVGFLTGLFDDAYNTIPWLKLAMQILSAVILILTGTYIHFYSSDYANYALTIFWVVGIMNAINLLDNMDAIASIVSLMILVAMVLAILILPQVHATYLLLLVGVGVSLMAFLRFNWHPSKMYMGDTGSMFLGVLLAAFGIIFLWNFKSESGTDVPVMSKILSIACIFALPIIDTTTVFVKRIFVNKRSPFVGGKDHTTHHLSYLGLKDTQVAFVFIGMAFFSGIMGVLSMIFSSRWNNFYLLAFGSFFVILFGFLFVISNVNTKRDEKK